ncbi:hypothetical protein MHK_005360 [Candidatus Magnetomorum sp. HK-1]|nr:hypothetical protein MHK_005360 [Candidatus Magnetomorum sp. HK-1]
MFQSLPGNSKIVGRPITVAIINSIKTFQSLPGNSKIVGSVLADQITLLIEGSFNPFQGILKLLENWSDIDQIDTTEKKFQSLPGNSKIVGLISHI